jgi:hypothetical protein
VATPLAPDEGVAMGVPVAGRVGDGLAGKDGVKKVRYFIDPNEAMRLEKKLSTKKGITDIVLGKA